MPPGCLHSHLYDLSSLSSLPHRHYQSLIQASFLKPEHYNTFSLLSLLQALPWPTSCQRNLSNMQILPCHSTCYNSYSSQQAIKQSASSLLVINDPSGAASTDFSCLSSFHTLFHQMTCSSLWLPLLIVFLRKTHSSLKFQLKHHLPHKAFLESCIWYKVAWA